MCTVVEQLKGSGLKPWKKYSRDFLVTVLLVKARKSSSVLARLGCLSTFLTQHAFSWHQMHQLRKRVISFWRANSGKTLSQRNQRNGSNFRFQASASIHFTPAAWFASAEVESSSRFWDLWPQSWASLRCRRGYVDTSRCFVQSGLPICSDGEHPWQEPSKSASWRPQGATWDVKRCDHDISWLYIMAIPGHTIIIHYFLGYNIEHPLHHWCLPSWQADDLDSLIADSLSGVQAALDGDRKAAAECPEEVKIDSTMCMSIYNMYIRYRYIHIVYI